MEKGLVNRERSPSDRRQVQVSITEIGRRVAANAPSPLQDKLSDALKNLPGLEQVSITLALEKVVELMEAGAHRRFPGFRNWPYQSMNSHQIRKALPGVLFEGLGRASFFPGGGCFI